MVATRVLEPEREPEPEPEPGPGPEPEPEAFACHTAKIREPEHETVFGLTAKTPGAPKPLPG